MIIIANLSLGGQSGTGRLVILLLLNRNAKNSTLTKINSKSLVSCTRLATAFSTTTTAATTSTTTTTATQNKESPKFGKISIFGSSSLKNMFWHLQKINFLKKKIEVLSLHEKLTKK